ncbi:MAG: DUF342 domain-containing protein [Aminipila sp.]
MAKTPPSTTEKRSELDILIDELQEDKSSSVFDTILFEDENDIEDSNAEQLDDDFLNEIDMEEHHDKKAFEKNPMTFTLFFSADKMCAYIRAQDYQRGKDIDNRIPKEVIYDLLKEKEVSYGIDNDGIQEYCKGKSLFKDFQVATGKRPIKGEDGSVEFFFPIDLRYAPKEKDDGTVDYKELGVVRNVNEGDLLCRITPPTDGVEGIDVLGNSVAPIPGKAAVVNGGKGVDISEDGLEYKAQNNGMVELNNGVVEVKNVYTIKGDVGPSTGNIRFNGAVMVMGSVLSDYAIYANGDIIVNGFVEASILNSTGNILINNGINGMKKGFLKADGNVTVKFAEMARIVSGGTFYCDYCINCDVRAAESIIGKGKRASLLGGNYIAGRSIEANTLGSDLNIPMEVQIIPDWQSIRNLKIKPEERIRENNEKICEHVAQISKIRTVYDGLENEINKLSRKNKFDLPEERAAKKKKAMLLMQKKIELKHEIDAIEEKIQKLDLASACDGCMIIVRKIIHTSVRICIGNATLRIQGHQEKQTYVEKDGMIESYSVTPGDSK